MHKISYTHTFAYKYKNTLEYTHYSFSFLSRQIILLIVFCHIGSFRLYSNLTEIGRCAIKYSIANTVQ